MIFWIQQEENKVKVISFLILIVFAVFVGFLINSERLANKTGPSDLVKKYYELAFDGKIDEALSLWKDCNPSGGICAKGNLISGENPIEGWTKGISKDKDKFIIKEEKIEDNTASVLVHTEFPNGYSQYTTYKLIKVKGKWFLNGLSSPAMEEADRNSQKNMSEK